MLIEVPAKAVAALGDRKRPPVRATVNAYTYRTTVAVYGDRFYLPLRKENRGQPRSWPEGARPSGS